VVAGNRFWPREGGELGSGIAEYLIVAKKRFWGGLRHGWAGEWEAAGAAVDD
jgi:hypothetical protein